MGENTVHSQKNLRLGNHLTLDELTRIEENANRSVTPDAETILRLCAALREAMQIRESALAIMDSAQRSEGHPG